MRIFASRLLRLSLSSLDSMKDADKHRLLWSDPFLRIKEQLEAEKVLLEPEA